MAKPDHADLALERQRSGVGWYRKQVARSVEWAEKQLPLCTTDAMKARLLEEMIARVAAVRQRSGHIATLTHVDRRKT